MCLLDAERHSILGNYDEAKSLYTRSIQLAHGLYVQEEAIASELAGIFFFERGCKAKSYSFFMHSIKCYINWGALAVAMRVQSDVDEMFGSGARDQFGAGGDTMLASIFASNEKTSSRKRSGQGI